MNLADQGSVAGLGGGSGARRGQGFVPLGQVADLRIVGGPPMVRDEGGLLVGYVYVDLDPSQRDIGGYVNEAKHAVHEALEHGRLTLPQGSFLRWTGQYEQMEKTAERMRFVIPATILIIMILLYAHFRNLVEVLIVLLSIPFALVGSVWLLWLLDYRLSTAVWVGLIALVGLAAQTGVVIIVYIDQAYERRRQVGKIRDLSDIVWAHMEGTVQRVRPKLMTVATMLAGLLPLLWASGSGADVMKRIAAPMVGGLLTSAFLTLGDHPGRLHVLAAGAAALGAAGGARPATARRAARAEARAREWLGPPRRHRRRVRLRRAAPRRLDGDPPRGLRARRRRVRCLPARPARRAAPRVARCGRWPPARRLGIDASPASRLAS